MSKEILVDSHFDSENKEHSGQLDLNSSLRSVAYWESSLFSKVYLDNDLKRDFSDRWTSDYDDAHFDKAGDTLKTGFYHFYNELRNIAKTLRGHNKKTLTETDTISKIIVPLLDCLGWFDSCTNNAEEPFASETSFTISGIPKNKTYRTDLILVNHPQEASFIGDAKDNDKCLRESRNYCIAPLEAKYWNRILDKEKSKFDEDRKRANRPTDDVGPGTSFNEQILRYMSILHSNWGIITDGNIWRLVNSEISGEAPERCFQFKIESLLEQETKIESGGNDEAEFLENAKYFYLFFGKKSYIKDETGKIFLDEVLKESRKYIDVIEEDLKDRFISAMNITCESLLSEAIKKRTISNPTDDDLKLIRTVAESQLFNILFIKSCEARSVLQVKAPAYYDISLTRIIDRISVFDPEKYTSSKEKDYINMRLTKSLQAYKFNPTGYSIYKNLIKLTEVIHDGAKKDDFGFEIKGFRESIFTPSEWKFAKDHPLCDEHMVRVLFELGYSKASKGMQRNYQQIPYNYFTPRQLGSIYESFLEYKLDIATEPMVYIQKGQYKQWVKLTSKLQAKLKGHEPIVTRGHAFFTPDNSERKATGSYYTPDYVVQYIVKHTLGPQLQKKTSKEILEMKVCDPAMGSGHFLIGALNFLATNYLLALENEVSREDIPSKAEIKRLVLNHCIYGIDINSRAVKLSKMSLWLESASAGTELEDLSDQIWEGDSLTSEKLENHEIPKMNFIIGNPPYVSELRDNKELFEKYRSNRMTAKYYEAKMDFFYFFIERGLDKLLAEGRLGFIIPQYWLTRSQTTVLHNKINDDSSITLHVDFGNNKVFESAPGMHSSILIVEKGSQATPGTEITLKGTWKNAFEIQEELGSSKASKLSIVFDKAMGRFKRKEHIDFDSWTLDDAMAAQGVVAPQENVINSHLSKLKGSDVGDGIFVLTSSELKSLNLSKVESDYVLKFIEARNLTAPDTVNWNDKYILYIDSRTAKKLEQGELSLPNIKRHLDKFAKINTSSNAPYGLHRAREKTLFEKGSKVLCVRKGKRQCFVWTNREIVVNQGVIVIQSGSEWMDRLLCLYLNSDVAFNWFRSVKTQGDIVQVDKEVLMRIPIPVYLKMIRETAGNIKIIDRMFQNYVGKDAFSDLEELSSDIKKQVS